MKEGKNWLTDTTDMVVQLYTLISKQEMNLCVSYWVPVILLRQGQLQMKIYWWVYVLENFSLVFHLIKY